MNGFALVLGLLTAFPAPQLELDAATAHLLRVPPADAPYIRYFTTYDIPQLVGEVPMRAEADLALPFVLNSCMSVKAEGNITLPKRVSPTLSYVDIRDFGWSIDDIDTVFALQPYFLLPLVRSTNNTILFRADWVIGHFMDVTKEDDRGVKDLPYYILLYGKGKDPKNADEFRKFWQVEIDTIRKQQVETGTIIDAGDSGVSQHTRQLRRGRTIFGYYWESRDVKAHDVDPLTGISRDYLEEIFATQVDAGQYIASHKNGLQVYLLTAGNVLKFKRVEFGDPTIVVDRQDARDIRVRTGSSCVRCHANGIIPYTNAIRDIFRSGGDLRAYDKELARAIQAFYFKENGQEVEDDNRIFERAIKRCNGLTPAANMKVFIDVYEWYSGKVSQAQAACQVGMTVEQFLLTIKPATTARLTQLYRGKSIPRDTWDTPNGGAYVQTMLLANRVVVVPVKPAVVTAVVVRVDQSPVYRQDGTVAVYLKEGSVATIVRDASSAYYQVRYENHVGYISKKVVVAK